MDDGSRLPWIIVVLLLFCAAFFAVAETAFASCPKSRVKAAAERGEARAKTALLILDDFDKAISTLLICTNIVHIATASIVTVAVTKMWGLGAVSISTIVTTIVVFFAGEMLPKSIAKKYSEPLALATGPVLRFLMKIFTPLSALLAWIGQSAAKLTPEENPVSFTEDELYDIIEDMTEDGSLDEQQGELISSALQFGEVTVESVLTPRVDLVAVDISSSLEDILTVIKTTNHSRLPVYEGSIDNIIGVLQIRKFIKAYLRLGNNLDLRPLMDEVFFIHQSTNIDELLPVMSKRKLNMAVVTDNYGGTLGIVTVEDILEELVGEIWDEHDEVIEEFKPQEDGSYLISCTANLDDLFDRFSIRATDIDSASISGWVMDQLGRLPVEGDRFIYENLDVTVTRLDHRRILEIRVAEIPEEDDEK